MNLQEKYEKIKALMTEAKELASSEEELHFISLLNDEKKGGQAGSYSIGGLALMIANDRDGLAGKLKQALFIASMMTEDEEAEDDE